MKRRLHEVYEEKKDIKIHRTNFFPLWRAESGVFQDGQDFSQSTFIMYWAGDGILAALLCMMRAYGVVDGIICLSERVYLRWHLD